MDSFWKSALVAVAAAAMLCAPGARAQEMSDEDYIHARQGHYRELGTAVKAVVDELKSANPRASTVKTAALQINRLAKQQYGWFRPGSGPESEEKTKAKPDIWAKPVLFKAAQDRFLAESNAFLAASNGAGAPKTMWPQVKSLVAACSHCHDTFRTD